VATVSEIVTSDWTENQNTITVLLTGSSVGDYVYSLDGTHYQTSNTFTGLQNGEYIVYVKDKNGCGIQPEDFYLLMYPKFFTPNGDGYNDYWRIKFSENESALTVHLFDKYGKLIKQLGSNSEGWNGTYNGQLLPATDYWFVVIRQNGKEYRGHFTLKR
jgi:gliding motility-associated-like protein